jgi:spore maturation protein CgeB
MAGTLEIFVAQSGKKSARVHVSGDAVHHLHSLVKPEVESDYFKDLTFWGDTILLLGTGLGYHLTSALRTLPPSAHIVIIDYFPECVEYCRSAQFAGRPNPVTTISHATDSATRQKIMESLRLSSGNSVQLIKHPASYHLNREFCDSAVREILAGGLRPSTGKKSAAPKPVLLFGSFFLQEECRRALEKSFGDQPALFKYQDYPSAVAYESALQKLVQSCSPPFILSINMKGFDGNGILGDIAAHFNIPVVVWFVDDPYPILLHQGRFIRRNMIACCWEKSFLPYLNTCGFGKSIYLPLAGDPALFSRTMRIDPTTPLGFVGSPMAGSFLRDLRSKFLWKDSLSALVDQGSDCVLKNPQTPVSLLIDQCARELHIPMPFSDQHNLTWLRSYVIHTASMKKRKSIVGSLMSMGIETFGDAAEWREMLGPSLTAHPDIDYSRGLADAYRSIAININVTSCQMPHAVNQRVFDIPLSGSFVLTDAQTDASELFKNDMEIVVYRDINELKDKIGFYRKNAGERDRITGAAQRRIIAGHTYYHRMQKIIALVSG